MSFLDRLYDWRNRLLSDPRFQTFAASFLLTRPIARARAGALFDICAGFVYSQTLFACVKLGIFEMLRDGALPISEIGRRCSLPPDGAERLVRAGCALGLLEHRSGERCGLGQHGAALLGNPGVSAMILHHEALYRDLADPVALLRLRTTDTHLARYWRYSSSDGRADLTPAAATAYSDLMAATQTYVSDEILHAFPLHRCGSLLDVGGGSGAFLVAAAQRAPQLKLALFDLPSVTELARARFATEKIEERVRIIAGDFHRDSLPAGADIITLIRILHDHDDDHVCSLLRKVHSALPPGGRLLIVEPLAQTRGAEAMGDAYFGLYLWAMGSGRPRTYAALRVMLAAAGFRDIRRLRTRRPVLTDMVLCRRQA